MTEAELGRMLFVKTMGEQSIKPIYLEGVSTLPPKSFGISWTRHLTPLCFNLHVYKIRTKVAGPEFLTISNLTFHLLKITGTN